MPDERLLVIGRGPEEDRLRPAARQRRDRQRCHRRPAALGLPPRVALVAPSLEDFGLTPLEAGAFGKPTLALRCGGYLDTVAEGVNGLFFDRPAPKRSRRRCCRAPYGVGRGRDRATRRAFDEETFRASIHEAVEGVLAGSV